MGELFLQRGLTVIVNDAVVSIGLSLLVVAQTILYFTIMMMVGVVFMDFSFTRDMGIWTLIFAMLFLLPIVVMFWINIEVVRSSHKAVVVCFVQVIFFQILALCITVVVGHHAALRASKRAS